MIDGYLFNIIYEYLDSAIVAYLSKDISNKLVLPKHTLEYAFNTDDIYNIAYYRTDQHMNDKNIIRGIVKGKYFKMISYLLNKSNREYNNVIIAEYAAEFGYKDIVLTINAMDTEDVVANNAAICAAKSDHRDIIKALTIKNNNICYIIAYNAAREGHIDIVPDMLSMIGNVNNHYTLVMALAHGGYKDVLDTYMNMYPNRLDDDIINEMAAEAASMGHSNIVYAMIDRGATDYGLMVFNAAMGPYMDIIDHIIQTDIDLDDIYNNIAAGAARKGHKELLYDMINNKGANNWDEIAGEAAKDGHKDIVFDMINNKNADNWNEIATYAAYGGHTDIVTLMIKKGATDYIQIAYSATNGGHIDIVYLMVNKGVKLNQLEITAVTNNRLDIVKLIIQKARKGMKIDELVQRAASNGYDDIVYALIGAGADIELAADEAIKHRYFYLYENLLHNY